MTLNKALQVLSPMVILKPATPVDAGLPVIENLIVPPNGFNLKESPVSVKPETPVEERVTGKTFPLFPP